MKKYYIKVEPFQADKFFIPARSKIAIIKLLMNTLRHFHVNEIVSEGEAVETGCYICVCDGRRMRRVVYVSDKKIFSIVFPFSYLVDNSKFETYGVDDLHFDSQLVSQVISVANEIEKSATDDILELGCVIEQLNKKDLWPVIKHLLTTEFGYLRYDFDEEHADGRIHPVHHLDIFSYNRGKFKLGLYEKMNVANFIDVLNLDTECVYIEKTD